MRRILPGWALLGAYVLVAALVLAANTPTVPAQEANRSYVGRIAGAEASDALIAVVIAPDGKAIAYVCSADDAWNQEHSRWYAGEMAPQGVLTATARDGKQLAARVEGDALTGTVDGLAFSADLVTEGTAGLYRGRQGEEIHAVIEAPDGTRVGGVWYASNGRWGWTWRFSPAVAIERTPTLLRLQRPPTAPPPPGPATPPAAEPAGQQFIFIELQSCVSAFDQCGNI